VNNMISRRPIMKWGYTNESELARQIDEAERQAYQENMVQELQQTYEPRGTNQTETDLMKRIDASSSYVHPDVRIADEIQKEAEARKKQAKWEKKNLDKWGQRGQSESEFMDEIQQKLIEYDNLFGGNK